MEIWSRLGVLRTLLRPYRRQLVFHAFYIAFYEMIKTIPVVLLKFIIDDIIAFSPSRIPHLALFAGLTLVSLGFMAWLHARTVLVNNKMIVGIGNDVMTASKRKMLGLGLDYHEQQALGKKINIVNEGAKDLKETLFLFYNEILPVAMQVVITLLLLLWFSWQIALMFALFIPVILLLNWQYANRVQPMRKAFRAAYNDASASLGQSIANVKTVKEFNMQEGQVKEYESHLGRFYDALMVRSREAGRVTFLEDLAIAFGRFGALALGIYLVIRSQITAGTLVMTFSLSEKVYLNLSRTGSFYIKVDEYLTSIEEIVELREQRENIARCEDELAVRGFARELRFNDVSFSYGGDDKDSHQLHHLHHVDFSIKKGASLAIVGRSGGGKTTLIKTLVRHYDVNSGAITLDGKDIRNLNLEQYRELFGIVSQDVELFNATVAQNIAYGRPQAKRDEIIDAAKRARAHEFILALPDGYETVIGERGVKLSGGQKQRIAIARALVRKPKILIFDEATSSLDSEAEKSIQDAVWRLRKQYTIIIVAHRLSTIMKADQLLVMEAGKVAGFGPLHKLSKSNPLFKRMLKLQNIGELRD